MHEMSARLLSERTASWSQPINTEGFTGEQALRAWLTHQGVTGYAQALLVIERFGCPAFFLASADSQSKGSMPTVRCAKL